MIIQNGIDIIDSAHYMKNRRLGLITNPTGVNLKLKSTANILAEKFNLVALYGPEHGIRQDRQAGETVQDEIDSELNIPVFSLFGDNKRLSDKMLHGVDMVVYDIQDIGARFYTYIYTMGYAMEECAKRDIPFVVLSRMNPLGCTICEGCCIQKNLDSFVGGYNLPARYAMTSGQLAQYIKDNFVPNCRLHIVPCIGLSASTTREHSRAPWIMPSPNIPTFDSALAYIGTCIFEGTNISEGRGTTRPFEIIGAPFINAPALVKAISSYELPGVLFSEIHFIPTFSKHAGTLCHGVQLHITKPTTFAPYKTGLLLLQEIARQTDKLNLLQPHFNNIAGTELLQNNLQDVTPILKLAEKDAANWYSTYINDTDMY